TEAHGSDAYTGAESAIALAAIIDNMILLNGVSGTGCVLLSAQPGRNAAVAATINKMVDFMVFLHISDKRKPARGG
ncbi:hypothetical protein, partial [Escherichia coli]|uniref:hypothetical protein n=3 Tax=Escherichia coli TaxID=562 RepID=UPI00235E1A12